METQRCQALEDVVTFQQHGLAAGRLPMAEAAVTKFAAEQQPDRIAEDGMIGSHEGEVLAGKGAIAVEGG